ncbi:MAG: FKBP-type peptidyl-prolyl cis-trans isomerase [Bacteroidales bacterium]|nr:FKBP-type peptidyl-prolyl cis-trans isomerase [Candidatus Liminaster caballi]
MKIDNGLHVTLQYTLTGWEQPEEGMQPEIEDIEKTTDERPFRFIYGVGMLIPAFEAQIAGKEPGDTFDFVLEPKDAYGEYDEKALQQVKIPMKELRDGGFPMEFVKVGSSLPLQNNNGEIMQSEITAVGKDEVTCQIDFNAPLAGMYLHFVGSIQDVHVPTEDDKKEYMKQMTGEAQCHCGGGCGGGNCGGNCGDCGKECGKDCDGEHHGHGGGCGHCHH